MRSGAIPAVQHLITVPIQKQFRKRMNPQHRKKDKTAGPLLELRLLPPANTKSMEEEQDELRTTGASIPVGRGRLA